MFALSLWSACRGEGLAGRRGHELRRGDAEPDQWQLRHRVRLHVRRHARVRGRHRHGWLQLVVVHDPGLGRPRGDVHDPERAEPGVSGEYRASFLASPNGETVAMQATDIAGGAGQPGLITGIPQFTFEFNLPGEVPAGDYLVGIACTRTAASSSTRTTPAR